MPYDALLPDDTENLEAKTYNQNFQNYKLPEFWKFVVSLCAQIRARTKFQKSKIPEFVYISDETDLYTQF